MMVLGCREKLPYGFEFSSKSPAASPDAAISTTWLTAGARTLNVGWVTSFGFGEASCSLFVLFN